MELWREIKAFKSANSPQSFPLEINNTPLLTAKEKAEAVDKYLKTEVIPNDIEFDYDIKVACSEEDYVLSQPITNSEFVTVLGAP